MRQEENKGDKVVEIDTKEKYTAKAQQWEERREQGGALTFLTAVAETQGATGIAMTTQT